MVGSQGQGVRRGAMLGIAGAVLLGLACASDPPSDSEWERQMRLAVDSIDRGEPSVGVEHYERALEAAAGESGDVNRLAYANWHLGDACYRYPESCSQGAAERNTRLALALFGQSYGPEHPVVIPILLRLSAIEAQLGHAEAADALLARADRITVRTFPEEHFMRARMGTHRPAAQLHPLEMLQILSEVDLLGG